MSETLHTCPTCNIPNFTTKGLKAHKCKSPKAQSVEVLGAESTLPEIALSLEARREEIAAWEQKFSEGTLEPRLQIGLQCLKANEVFALKNPGERNADGKNQHSVEATSRRDKASTEAVTTGETAPAPEPTTYSEWLETAVPWLARATAYKYADAVQGLGCNANSAPDEVTEGLKQMRRVNASLSLPPPSLASLVKAYNLSLQAPPPEKDAAPLPDAEAIRIGDAREKFQRIRDAWEESITRGQLDDLPKEDLLALSEFLQAARDRIKARLK
jgi:hypothetical protein